MRNIGRRVTVGIGGEGLLVEFVDTHGGLRTRNLAVDAVELITVTDVEPYVEGSRRLRDRWKYVHG